jgi:hypothetical protein
LLSDRQNLDYSFLYIPERLMIVFYTTQDGSVQASSARPSDPCESPTLVSAIVGYSSRRRGLAAYFSRAVSKPTFARQQEIVIGKVPRHKNIPGPVLGINAPLPLPWTDAASAVALTRACGLGS